MAGGFVLSEEETWTAASWLFDWVIEGVASEVRNRGAADKLALTVRSGVRHVDLTTFDNDEWRSTLEALSTKLVPAAEAVIAEWSADVDKAAVLQKIGTLADMGCAALLRGRPDQVP